MDVQSGKEIDPLVKLLMRVACKVAVECPPPPSQKVLLPYLSLVWLLLLLLLSFLFWLFLLSYYFGFWLVVWRVIVFRWQPCFVSKRPAILMFAAVGCMNFAVKLVGCLNRLWWHQESQERGDGRPPPKSTEKCTIGYRWVPNAPSQLLYYSSSCCRFISSNQISQSDSQLETE